MRRSSAKLSRLSKTDLGSGLSVGCGIGQIFAAWEYELETPYFAIGISLAVVSLLLGVRVMLSGVRERSMESFGLIPRKALLNKLMSPFMVAGTLLGMALSYGIFSFFAHHDISMFARRSDALFYLNIGVPIAVATIQMLLYLESEQGKDFDLGEKTSMADRGRETVGPLSRSRRPVSLEQSGEDAHLAMLRDRLDETKSRLQREIYALGKRANLNLIIGIATSLAGIGLLWYFVVVGPLSHDLYYYAMRLSTVVFVEVFSFFFLRLYRASLDGIKYFQNELTNVEIRFVCIESALLKDAPPALLSLLSELVKTERNFILKQGETTVELKQAEVARENYGELAKAALQALGKIGKP